MSEQYVGQNYVSEQYVGQNYVSEQYVGQNYVSEQCVGQKSKYNISELRAWQNKFVAVERKTKCTTCDRISVLNECTNYDHQGTIRIHI